MSASRKMCGSSSFRLDTRAASPPSAATPPLAFPPPPPPPPATDGGGESAPAANSSAKWRQMPSANLRGTRECT